MTDIQEIIKIAANYGAIGLVCVAAFWYINQKDKEHKIERDEWSDKMREMHKEAIDSQNRSTTVVTELVTLIRDRRGV